MNKLVKVTFYILFLFTIHLLILFPKHISAAPIKIFSDPLSGHEIWQMTNGSQFEGPYYYTNPLYSPNGKYFVYLDKGTSSYLSIMNADGTNKRSIGPSDHSSSGGGIGSFGWWSPDSKYYYTTSGLYRIIADTGITDRIPNATSYLPFYYPILSPDGKRISGIANYSDTTSQGILKLVNTDGTNYRSLPAPVQPSGSGFDVTHGWVGNNQIWYLNNSVNALYRNIMRVVDVNSLIYKGTLNAVLPEDTTYEGTFGHPSLSNEGFMIGGTQGLVTGQCGGTGCKYMFERANTLLVNTTFDIAAKQLTSTIDTLKYPSFIPNNPEQNFSPDGKYLLYYGVNSNCSTLDLFPVDKASSPYILASYGPSSICSWNSGYGPYGTWSPDGTKIIFGSQYQLPDRNLKNVSSDDMNVYQAVVKKPDVPTKITAQKSDNNVVISWNPANLHKEIKEYEVYSSSTQNGVYTLLAGIPQIYTYLNNLSTLGVSDTTIAVDDTSAFITPVVLEISGISSERPSELVYCTNKTNTSFTNCVRGYAGTTPSMHYNDAFVWFYTGYIAYTDQNVTGSKWYKIRSVEWSGLKSEFSNPVGLSEIATPYPTGIPTPIPTGFPTPYPTTCVNPGPITGHTPSGTLAACTNSITFSWNDDPNADHYRLRIDQDPESWGGSCSNVYSGDTCIDNLYSNSYTRAVTPGKTYKWWVEAVGMCN